MIFKVGLWIVLCAGTFAGLAAAKFGYSHHTVSPSVGFHTPLRNPPELLLLGSSHTRLSIDVRLLEQETGQSAFALAYNGMDFYLMRPVLEFLAARNALPDLLLLESYVATASAAPRFQDKNLYLSAPPALKRELISTLQSTGVDAKGLYEMVISSKSADVLASPLTRPQIDRAFYRGTHVTPQAHHMTPAQFGRVRPPPTLPAGGHPLQLDALAAIFALLKEHKVTVVFYESPMPTRTEQNPKFRAAKQALRGRIEDAGYRYVDGAEGFDGQNPRFFMDAGHLSGFGRQAFSGLLVRRLQQTPEYSDTFGL
ncbi:MAG: hypothetical protein AAGA23_11080 [Pseudomonadota bacterium]